MTVRRRGKSWMIDKQIDGVRVRKTIKTARTKAEASQAEAKIVHQLWQREYDPYAERVLFAEFIESKFMPYSKANKRSHSDDERITVTLCTFFEGKTLDEITPGMVEDYKQDRLAGNTKYKRQRQPATVDRELMVLSRIFSLAIEGELIAANPCARVKRLKLNNKRVRYLTPAEEVRLLKELEHQPQARNIVIMALHTGMRRGEIFNLKWQDVDFARQVVNVLKTKTDEPRAIPMNPVLLQMLKTVRDKDANASGDSYVFPSEKTGGRLRDIKHSFRNALDRAKITDFKFHDLRHSAGTRLADAGVHLVTIANVLGHADLRTTQRYTHAIDAAKRDAMAKLGLKSVLGGQAVEAEEKTNSGEKAEDVSQ